MACEDKEEPNPLVGTWNMTSASGGVYIKVNKTQEIFMGLTQGSIEVSTISNGITTQTHALSQLNVNNNDDGLFINAYEYSDDRQVDYYINDYIASLDQYDQSSVRIYTPNGYYEYVGTQFNYTLQEKSFTVNADTVYRQLYIDGNFVMDSTRYAVVLGTLTQIGTEIEANQNFLMPDQLFLPDDVTITINDDGTGEIEETFEGFEERSDIEWEATDSTFTWRYCEEYDGQIECNDGPEFMYQITEGSLILSDEQDICEEMGDSSGDYCDQMMFYQYGIEMGTLDGFWMEMEVVFSKQAATAKLTNEIREQKKPRIGKYSILKGFKLHK
jgi:hypothetical protein